jgi:hypothetical protein
MNPNKQITDTLPAIAAPYGGGFYVGQYQIDGEEYVLIVAPKAAGEREDTVWHTKNNNVEGAKSYCDGLANTQAMAAAGSELAQWALALDIDGLQDWYLPSLDELEICYRALKPTPEGNSQWARSGINLSTLPPAWPYTADLPQQTSIEAFQDGGSEAFEAEPYWTSTQHAANGGNAWAQYFSYGYQSYWLKCINEFRARAVRKIKA